MLKIAIVDDDKNMLNHMKILINNYTNETTIDIFDDSIAFFKIANNHFYDLVFLDIQMPQLTGFELAEALIRLNYSEMIVFVSSYEQLVFDSFKFKPFGFVRKEKLNDDIKDIFDRINKRQINESFFTIKTAELELNVNLDKILYFESMSHNIFVSFDGKKYKIKRSRQNEITMNSLSSELKDKGFIKVHKSYLVNYKYIHFIDHKSIVLKNNEIIDINPRNINAIKATYQTFIMSEGE